MCVGRTVRRGQGMNLMLSLSLSESKLDVARLPQSEFRQKAGSFEGNSAGTDDLAVRLFAA